MIPLAQGHYTEQQVRDQLYYKNGSRETGFRFVLLNHENVEIGELKTITGRVSYSSLAQIKRTGSFKLAEYEKKDIDFFNDRVQPYFTLKMPDGGTCEWPLGIFFMPSPNRETDGAVVSRDIKAYDLSLVLGQDKFENVALYEKGANIRNAVAQTISGAGLIKINIPSYELTFATDKEYPIGESKLTAVNDMLGMINFTSLYIDENGSARADPYISPGDRPTDHRYQGDELSILAADASETLDIFDVPNVFVATCSDPESAEPLYFSFENNNPASILSTVRRRRRIVEVYEFENVSSIAVLESRCRRAAAEASQVFNKIKFYTAAMPNHGYADMLYLSHEKLGTAGKFTETSWEFEFSPDGGTGRMTHEARRLMQI